MAGLIKRSFVSLSAVALAMFVNSSAYGVTLFEPFNDDPTPRGWSGVGNTTGGNNYGFSATNNTLSGAGEIGGFVNRGPDSFYGVDLGGAFDPNTMNMSVSGVMNNVSAGSSTTLNMGWSQGYSTVVGDGGDPGAFLGITWDDGVSGDLEARGNVFGIDGAGGPNRPIDSITIPFSMTWDSATATLTVDLNGDVGTLGPIGDVNDIPDLTHWGLFGRTNHSPDNGNVIWLDNIEFTAISEIVVPEPASLGLLSLGGLMALRRRRA